MRLVGGQLDDAVTQAYLLRALAGRGEEDFWGGRMRIFFQEVMLHFPHVIIAEAIGEFDLQQRVLE